MFATLAILASLTCGTTIYNDNGGSVLKHAIHFQLAKKPICVTGTCESACTLVLKFPSTCAGPSAAFVFHAPTGTGPRAIVIRNWMMQRYRPAIRKWVKQNGGLSRKPIKLEGAELRSIVRACT